MRHAKADPATLARLVGVAPGDIEAWRAGEPIPTAMARKLAAHLHTTAADILFGLSYDPRAPDPVIDDM